MLHFTFDLILITVIVGLKLRSVITLIDVYQQPALSFVHTTRIFRFRHISEFFKEKELKKNSKFRKLVALLCVLYGI